MKLDSQVSITVGALQFTARLETEKSPIICAEFLKLLPLKKKLLQARWSGESAWIPLANLKLNVDSNNLVTHPAPGQILFYPGGISETEILFPFGKTIFRCKEGELAGIHFLTIIDGLEQLSEVGRQVLWNGSQDITVQLLAGPQ